MKKCLTTKSHKGNFTKEHKGITLSAFVLYFVILVVKKSPIKIKINNKSK